MSGSHKWKYPMRCWIVEVVDLDNVYTHVGDALKGTKPWPSAVWVDHHWEMVFENEDELGSFVMEVIGSGESIGMSKGFDRVKNPVPVIFLADIYFGFFDSNNNVVFNDC